MGALNERASTTSTIRHHHALLVQQGDVSVFAARPRAAADDRAPGGFRDVQLEARIEAGFAGANAQRARGVVGVLSADRDDAVLGGEEVDWVREAQRQLVIGAPQPDQADAPPAFANNQG